MTSSSDDIIHVLNKHTSGTNYDGAGIGRLLESYEFLVEQSEREYGLDEDGHKYEFDNDLYIRSLLQKIITDPAVNNYAELELIAKKIHSLDERLKASPKGDDFEKYCEHYSIGL